MTRARSLSRLANSNVFTVSTTDNRVGIGSTIPDVKLDVGGDLYADNLTINNLIGVAATFSGVVSYEDVTNVDSVGIITAQSYVSIADSIVHTGDTDTSIRFPSADTFTVETAGSERLRVNSSGDVGVGTITPGAPLEIYNSGPRIRLKDSDGTDTYAELSASTGAIFISHRNGVSNGQLIFQGLGGGSVSEYARFDTSGRLLVGTNTARTINTTNSYRGVQIAGTTGFESLIIERYEGSGGPAILLGKSRGTSVGDYTIVQDDDGLGSIILFGADGSDMNSQGARIDAYVDGTPGTNEMPGRLVFSTNDGTTSASPTERMRISANGDINIDSGAFYFDAVNDRFAVGTTSPFGSLHVRMGTNENIYFTSGIGEIGNVPGFQGINDAGSALTSIGMRGTDIRFATGNSERLRIDSSGRLIIGHTASINVDGHTSALQVNGETYNESTVSILSNTNDSNGSYLFFSKQRSGSSGGTTIVQNGDTIGQIRFLGMDGSDYDNTAASIECNVDGTPGSNDIPGRLRFFTADGGSNVERLRIDSVGTIHFKNGLMIENGEVTATAASGVQSFDLVNGMVLYRTGASTGTWKPNFRVNGSISVNSKMGTGDVISPTLIVAKGATTHYADTIQVDGSDVTPEWLGGAPTDGGGSGTFDVYSYTIIKTGDATFKAFASVSTYE